MLLKTGKEKCDCGKMAQWIYMPGFSGGASPYFCDDCVSNVDDIGCSCCWNTSLEQEGLPQDLPEGVEGKDWRWVVNEANEYMGEITKEDGYWISLDERGRPYPCVEYEYDEYGFDKYTWLGDKLLTLDIWFYFFKIRTKRKLKGWWNKHVVKEVHQDYRGF
jgi:hypothetical protein